MRADSVPVRAGAAMWRRRALVGLWVLAFVLVGGVLATRWDALMAQLARPPAAGDARGGALP
jgi:hypothetical protein